MGTQCNSCKVCKNVIRGKDKELNMTEQRNLKSNLKHNDSWGQHIMGFERESENFINVRSQDINQKDTCYKDRDDLASKFDPNNYTSSHDGITCVIQNQDDLTYGGGTNLLENRLQV